MQQLLFQRSNGHQVHQDTAFVAVEEPLLLVATWIALEDVVEGSDELAYYDRSHRLPHCPFADGSKRFSGDMQKYTGDLETACREGGYEYRRFLARKGDMFFWTADLVHRSHPRTLPPETSRLSCVTHYCPATSVPFWFRMHPDNQGIEPEGLTGGFVSSYYKLPNHGEMVRPSRDLAS